MKSLIKIKFMYILTSKILLLVLFFLNFNGTIKAQPIRLGSQITLGITAGGCAPGCVTPVPTTDPGFICNPGGTGNHPIETINYTISIPGNQYITITAQTSNCDVSGPGLDGSDNFLINGVQAGGPFSNDAVLNFTGCYHNPCPTPFNLDIQLIVNRRDEIVELDWSFSVDDPNIPGVTCVQLATPTIPTFNQHPDICEGGTINLPTTSTNGITGVWSPAPDNSQTTTYTFTPTSGGCATTAEMTIIVTPLTDGSFQIDPFCVPSSMPAYNIATPGGIFDFNPNPGNGAIINAGTGEISNAVPGNYSVSYTPPGMCPELTTVQVEATALENASFSFNDFCVGASNGPTNIITPGGTFSFDPMPGDGAMIDPTTGEISNAVGGSSYTVRYTTNGMCPGTSTQIVQVLNAEDPSFSFANFCVGASNGPTNIVTPGGTFSFDPNPGDGATIDATTGVISNATSNTYNVKYTTPGACPGELIVSVTATAGPSGTLSGSDILCPGQCTQFSFSFTSGSEPYTLNLSANPPGIALPPIPGVNTNQVFTVCYGGPGVFPTVDLGSFTITIPSIFSGTGSLVLTGISDASGCPGTVSGSFSLTLTNAPTAQTAGPLNACGDANGIATFDLTTLDNTITSGNSSLTVLWFEDMAGTIPIANPSSFQSSGGTVYAQVTNGSCESTLIPIVLIVENGNVPFIDMYCVDSGTDLCTFCIFNGQINLGFTFGDNNTYNVVVEEQNTSNTFSGQVSNVVDLNFSGVGGTYVLLDLQPTNGCQNTTTFTDMVVIDLVQAPDIFPFNTIQTCDPVILPPINGNNLTGSVGYFSAPNGLGTPYNPGDIITSSTTLYAYDSNAGCDDQEILTIIIDLPITIYIPDEVACNPLTLPLLTSFGLSSSAYYNTSSNGNGITYNSLDIVTSSVVLYIIDPSLLPGCLIQLDPITYEINTEPIVPNVTTTCLGSTANVEVTNTYPNNHSFSLDGGPLQTSNIFSNVGNGTHTLTVVNLNTTCESSILFNVNCNCPNPGIINLPLTRDTVCINNTYTLSNISFSGNITDVTMSTNGTGILTPLSAITSPFSLSYTPNLLEINSTINIVLTSNDPDGNGPCSEEIVVVQLFVSALPQISLMGPDSVCIGSFADIVASGGTSYIWSNGATTSLIRLENITIDTTISVIGFNQSGCSSRSEINIDVYGISAGRDTIISVCSGTLNTINLFSFLSQGIDTIGVWKLTTDTIRDPKQFDLTLLSTGTTAISYILDNQYCTPDTAFVVLNVRDKNFAGSPFSITSCQGSDTSFDFERLLGSHNSGRWVVPLVSGINISNPFSVSLSTILPGQYEVQHIVDGNLCTPDTVFVSIDVVARNSAGNDIISNQCRGSIINLRSLLTSDPGIGSIVNTNNYSGFSSEIWNTTNANEGRYIFYHVVDNSMPCQNDTASIIIDINTALSAGENVAANICGEDVIDLKRYLSPTSSLGGRFFYQGNELPNGIFSFTDNMTSYLFTYEIGDDIACPKVSSEIQINRELAPSITLSSPSQVCEGECLEVLASIDNNTPGFVHITLTTNGPEGMNSFDVIRSSNGLFTLGNICVDKDLPLQFNIVRPGSTGIIAIDSFVSANGCTFEFDINITFEADPLIRTEFNPTICSGQQLSYSGTIFDEQNRFGTVVRTSNSGCDTLVNVNLSFFPENVSNLNLQYCSPNQTLTIGNKLFNLQNPSGQVILENADIHGCDSIINVMINYDIRQLQEERSFTTCNQNFEYVLNGQIFNKNRPTGSVIIPNATPEGCDSTINVILNFLDLMIQDETVYLCETNQNKISLISLFGNGPYQVKINSDAPVTYNSLPIILLLNQGTYTIEVSNQEGCTETLNYTFENTIAPTINLDQSMLQDGSIMITTNVEGGNIYNLAWTPSNGLSCTNCLNPIVSPSITMDYTLTYSFGEECSDSKTISIIGRVLDIIIPNIFSPNGDGINDIFYVQAPNGMTISIKNFGVYDRWGNAVFLAEDVPSNDPSYGWNGNFQGRPVVPGVYVYKLELNSQVSDKPLILSGSVQVIR